MIRLIFELLIILLVGIYSIPEAIVCFIISKYNKDAVINYRHKFIRFIFKVFSFIAGVKIHVEGLSNIDEASKEKAIFIISNHRGFFDTIIGYSFLKFPCGFVAKDELKKVPILGYWMKNINCLFIDRKDVRSGAKMVIDAINSINNGISMWVFPEGTRNKNVDERELLEFKAGAFKIPEKSNCKILPIAFVNTNKIFEDHIPFIKSGNAYVKIGKLYSVSDIGVNDATDCAMKSQIIIKELISEIVDNANFER